MPEAKGRACCAACSQYFDVDKMDIVTYGSGYRCSRCSEVVGAMEQNVAAIDESREREREARASWGLFDWLTGLFK